jgi:Bacterial membrane protein YfhO
MNKIRHRFMFYPAYVRLVLLLLGCAGLDRVLEGRSVEAPRRSLAILVLGSAAVLYFGGWGFDRLARLGGAPAALLVLVPCAILGLVVLRPSQGNRALLGGALLLVALVDLCSYFRQVSQFDGDFTARRGFVTRPLPPPVVQALKRVWAPLDPEHPSTLFDNMPIKTALWPGNTYTPHIFLAEVRAGDPDPWTDTFIGFHPVGDPTWTSRMARDVLTPLPHEWRQRDYNAWKMVVDAPSAGWLSVAQLYDPGWRATVDRRPAAVQRANVVRSAVPINGGRHEVEMVYRPLSRRLYWPASAALQLTLLLIAVAAFRARSYRAIKFRAISVSLACLGR